SGHVYIAKRDVVDTTTDPANNDDDWSLNDQSTGGQNKTNSRIANAQTGAQSGINGASGSVGNSAASNGINSVPGEGTTATIDGTVVAGGHINVIAVDNLSVFGIAGAAAAGAVGIGGSVLVLNVDSATNAGVGGSADLTATGPINVSATMDEHSTPIGF